tara:strand:+ start:7777 stop:8247 length:471 start_codon:yes stop_codon:yes gene_type:complete
MNVKKVDNRVEKLNPEFAAEWINIQDSIAMYNLPLKVFETYRSPERQTYLFDEGRSKLKGKQGAHTYGMAVDVILDIDNATDLSGLSPWETGVSGGQVVLPDVLAVWLYFGRVLQTEHPTVTWGGNWRKGRKKPLGWDPYHVELDNWTLHALGKQS